jgi:hypothetical protein
MAQTEYDANLMQAEQQEDQYRQQLQAEDKRVEPYREAYLKQLESLETLAHKSPTAHGKNSKLNAQITSLEYWLKQEDLKESREDTELKNLDGWRAYWQSKKDCVLRTQAWNQEQIEQDQRAAERQQLEAQAQAARDAHYQSLVDSENSYNNGYGGYGGGYGRGGYSHGGYSHGGHTIHIHGGGGHSHH